MKYSKVLQKFADSILITPCLSSEIGLVEKIEKMKECWLEVTPLTEGITEAHATIIIILMIKYSITLKKGAPRTPLCTPQPAPHTAKRRAGKTQNGEEAGPSYVS